MFNNPPKGVIIINLDGNEIIKKHDFELGNQAKSIAVAYLKQTMKERKK